MNKEIILILNFIIILGFVFSASVPLVKYYDNSTSSHACLPSSISCHYTQQVMIDEIASSICSSPEAIEILGLSGVTNAHIELGNFSNYPEKICMKKKYIDDNTFYFTQPGINCKSEYNCLFSLNNINNSHLSACGVFGSSEIKFCGLKEIYIPPIVNGVCFYHGAYPAEILTVPITERCLSGNAINYIDFNSNNIASWTCQGIGDEATSSECYATIQECTPPLCPNEDTQCNIFSFNILSSIIGKGTTINYSCHTNNTDVNFAIYDIRGNQVYPFTGEQHLFKDLNSCENNEKEFNLTSWPTQTTPKDIYLAQLSIGNNCVKQDFFTVTYPNNSSSPINDSNIFLSILVCVTLIIISTKNKKN